MGMRCSEKEKHLGMQSAIGGMSGLSKSVRFLPKQNQVLQWATLSYLNGNISSLYLLEIYPLERGKAIKGVPAQSNLISDICLSRDLH